MSVESLVQSLEDAERIIAIIEILEARGTPPEPGQWGFAIDTMHGEPKAFRYDVDRASLRARAVEVIGHCRAHQVIIAKRERHGRRASPKKLELSDRLGKAIQALAKFINPG